MRTADRSSHISTYLILGSGKSEANKCPTGYFPFKETVELGMRLLNSQYFSERNVTNEAFAKDSHLMSRMDRVDSDLE